VQLDQDWSLSAFTAEFLRRSDSTDSFRASATKGEAERRGPRCDAQKSRRTTKAPGHEACECSAERSADSGHRPNEAKR
jgi:hypothetical protein